MDLDEGDKKLLANVEKYGWQSLHVHDDDEGPGFSFSIGFWESLDSPEVIIFGLRSELMHNMLWEIFRQIKAGRNLEDGARRSDLIEGFDCLSRPVHVSQMREYFGTALWYKQFRTGNVDIKAYQLFWPGKLSGQFPWDADCDPVIRESQPALYLAR